MTEHQPWIDKYAPDSFDEIQGNNSAIDSLKNWAENFPADREAQLLEGPPGVGKSTTAEIIADWLDLQMVELNASEARRAKGVERAAAAVSNTTAEGERRLVLLDEADSWHHATDKTPLYDALDDPANPTIITVNDKYETPQALLSRANVVDFSLGKRSRKAKLKKLRDAEDLDTPDSMLDTLSERPDLRSAINDYQIFADRDEIPEDQRDWALDEMDMIDRMLTGTPDLGGERPRDGISPGEALLWLDENISGAYRGLELAWAYETLHRADIAMMRNYEMAQEMIRSVARLRITEPYYDDEISWKKKNFPEWFRHSKPDATGGSDEAKLYRALSNFDDGTMGISQSFSRFLAVGLPRLKALDDEEKHELILAERLSPEEYEALDITEKQHESWLEEEAPSEGEWGGTTEDAAAW